MTLSLGGIGLAALFMALLLGRFGRFDMEYLGLLISCRGFGCSISCLPLSPLPSEGMAFLLALENTFFGGLVTSWPLCIIVCPSISGLYLIFLGLSVRSYPGFLPNLSSNVKGFL